MILLDGLPHCYVAKRHELRCDMTIYALVNGTQKRVCDCLGVYSVLSGISLPLCNLKSTVYAKIAIGLTNLKQTPDLFSSLYPFTSRHVTQQIRIHFIVPQSISAFCFVNLDIDSVAILVHFAT